MSSVQTPSDFFEEIDRDQQVFLSINNRPLSDGPKRNSAVSLHKGPEDKHLDIHSQREPIKKILKTASAADSSRKVIIIDFENVCIFLEKLLGCADPIISRAAQRLDRAIARLAEEFFHLNDFSGKRHIASVHFLEKYDDGHDLKGYSFSQGFTAHENSPTFTKYGRRNSIQSNVGNLSDRAFAYRLRDMANTYDQMPSWITQSIALRQVENAYEALEEQSRNVHSRARKLLRRLLEMNGKNAGTNNLEFYVISSSSHQSIPMLLATCIAFRLQPLIPADHIFVASANDRKSNLWSLETIERSAPAGIPRIFIFHHRNDRAREMAREVCN